MYQKMIKIHKFIKKKRKIWRHPGGIEREKREGKGEERKRERDTYRRERDRKTKRKKQQTFSWPRPYSVKLWVA